MNGGHAEYRIDLVDDDHDEPLSLEFFEARDHGSAFAGAAKILCRMITDPAAQYGELYVRDGAGDSADYLGQVEPAAIDASDPAASEAALRALI